MAEQRIPELDGLRGLAIGLVIAFHLVMSNPTGVPALDRVLLFGWSGVDLFFVLSGFLIGGILLDTRGRATYFRNFYARRAFRILPVYLSVLAVYAIGWAAGGPVRAQLAQLVGAPMNWYTYLSFTNDFWLARHHTMDVFLSPSWSLAIEEQFYLTLPLLVRIVPRRRLAALAAGGVGLVLAVRVPLVLHGSLTQTQAYVLPHLRADGLMIGFGCALLVRNERALEWLTRTKVLYFALALFAAAVVVTGGALPPAGKPPASAVMTWGLTAIALFYAALLLLAVTRSQRRGLRLLRAAPLRRLGVISYCVYLLHEPLIDAANRVLGRSWLAGACAVALVIVLARLSWTWIESPALRLGGRFRHRAAPAPRVAREPDAPAGQLP